ncbi:unnamed protein product [marine sediment metagenome]|uniref:Uncharacterized protein n=1 Tax=marine sediment metagenome TaxID=412755 RepID=X1L9W0_9ZZZZ
METETRVYKIIKSALKFQGLAASKIPPEKREEGEGRIGKLVVDDPTGVEHTIIYFQVMDGKLHMLDEKPEAVRNEIIFLGMPERGYYGIDLFIDMLKERGLMRKAYTENWLIVTGDLASYDSEEITQLVEEFIDTIAKKMSFR